LVRKASPISGAISGFVFQDYKLLPHKTIYENIALALKVVGTPYGDIERRTYQVLKKVSMENKQHLTPPKLSGGGAAAGRCCAGAGQMSRRYCSPMSPREALTRRAARKCSTSSARSI